MTGSEKLSILVLGTTHCMPEKGENTASCVVDGRVVVDTGWFLVDRLLAADVDPLDIEAVLLTHCHHDHILGLPQLYYYHAMERSPELPRLYGPAGEVERVAEDTARFLQADRYPELDLCVEIIGLEPDQSIALHGLQVSTCAARHNVPGLCYRVERTGRSVVFSGDTAFNPDLIELARGADLLIHEASMGAGPCRDDPDAHHSGAPDAAEVARRAGVKRLALVHAPLEHRDAALAAARKQFPNTSWPADGETLLP
jgi:ribonuclease Z